MAKNAKAPKGWARVLVSSWDDVREEWFFAAANRDGEVARVYGEFYVLVPVTPEAQAEAMSGAATTFQIGTGPEDKLKVSGPEGPAARKYYADRLEPVRGEFRKLGEAGAVPTAERLQTMLDEYEPYTGRGGRRTPEVSEAELAKAIEDGTVAELIARIGVKVS